MIDSSKTADRGEDHEARQLEALGKKLERNEAAAALEQERRDEALSSLFGSDLGREALAILLEEWHVFDTIEPGDIEAIALRNYGLSLLATLGAFDTDGRTHPLARVCSLIKK